MTPIKAIRLKCLDCMCGNAMEVKLCPAKDCSLYEFRLGHNPNITPRQMTEEQKAAAVERLRLAREKQLQMQRGSSTLNEEEEAI